MKNYKYFSKQLDQQKFFGILGPIDGQYKLILYKFSIETSDKLKDCKFSHYSGNIPIFKEI